MTSTPREIMYSQALKGISVPSSAVTRKFQQISSGPYNQSNNIIRVPLNANAFINMKDGVLKYKLINKSNRPMILDSVPFSRLVILAPSGAQLEQIDQYNKLVSKLSQLECSRDNFQGIRNLIEGTSNGQLRIRIQPTAVGVLTITINNKISGVLTLATANDRVDFGNYSIVVNATGTGLTTFYKGVSGGTIVYTGNGTQSVVPFLNFVTGGTSGATLLLNNFVVGNAGNAIIDFIHPDDFTNKTNGTILAHDETIELNHTLISCLTNMETFLPALSISGGGLIVELTLAPASEVLFGTGTETTPPAYELNGVEFVVPVINFSDTVNTSFKQMISTQGSVSMSSTSYQTFLFPVTTGGGTISIPLALRARSLKALYFMFVPNGSATNFNYPRGSASESPISFTYLVRIGSNFYPASNVKYDKDTNLTEAVVELEKSVSKLSDIRHGSLLNRDNFTLTQNAGSTALFGLDFETVPTSFLESGVDLANNSLLMFLEINSLSPQVASGSNTNTLSTGGNVIVFTLFDNSISIMANGDVIRTL